jgi:hypothetical protein
MKNVNNIFPAAGYKYHASDIFLALQELAVTGGFFPWAGMSCAIPISR